MIEIRYGTLIHEEHQYIVATSARGVCFVGSPDQSLDELSQFIPDAQLIEHQAAVIPAITALQAYLNGSQTDWHLPLDMSVGTDFQKSVWQALQTIPYGQTTTYSQIAAQIGHPKAVRAVASAVGRNPLLIIIPCHRVFRKDGQIGGYRGGHQMKHRLQQLESHNH